MTHPSSPATTSQPDHLSGKAEFIRQAATLHPMEARRQLTPFLEQLLQRPPEEGELFELLELSRPLMAGALNETARFYLNKPLPLSTSETSQFAEVITSLRLMVRGYANCAERLDPASHDPAHIATVIQRCLAYSGAIIFEHFRVRRELPHELWLHLHGFYATAEQWGVTLTQVSDPMESGAQSTHCAATYVAFLLIDIASPYSQGLRQLNLIRRWAAMWAPLVVVHHLEDDLEVPPYVVELMKNAPLHHIGNAESLMDDARWLDTTRLGLQIHHHIGQLQQRISPSQLGLGEESHSLVSQLLQRLARPWTQIASPRRFRRFNSSGTTKVALSFETMYANIAGQEFAQPVAVTMYSHRAYNHLATFGEQVSSQGTANSSETSNQQAEFPSESWSVINHSANGFRLAASIPEGRIAHNQLLAACPHDGTLFLLCRVTWLMQEENGALVAGLATLPGLPKAVAARPDESKEPFIPAFLLDPIPSMNAPASIILPPASYQPRKVYEIAFDGTRQKVRLLNMLERGHDFERMAYELV